MITLVMPVGPRPAHKQWIGEAMASVRDQGMAPAELLVIDDMADIEADDQFIEWRKALEMRNIPVRVWRSPWRVGVGAAMNFGVALARTEFSFMMCADDTLQPELMGRLVNAIEHMDEATALQSYFFVGVHYMGGEWEDQFLPCGAAMVSKTLWRRCGGFPPETGSGAPDAALISTMMVHSGAGQYIGIAEGHTLYNVRTHADQDGAGRTPWQGVILASRDLLTQLWQPPDWERFDP